MNPHASRCLNALLREAALMKLARRAVYFACFCFLMLGAVPTQGQGPAKAGAQKSAAKDSPAKTAAEPAASQKLVEQGIAIDFSLNPLKQKPAQLLAGEEGILSFKVTDTTTNTPVKGLSLSVWMSMQEGDKALDPKQCREKIQSFLQGSMRNQADVDLNSYYIITLNKSPDISVINPLLGFGGSKLLTLVHLKSPGEDWVLSRDGEQLFVSLPQINQLAVIDTRLWTVTSYIDTGIKPTRIALQPDQKYLWVANNGNGGDQSGVTAIDTSTLKVAAQIATGAGHHEVVISSDNHFAFVSNSESGAVSIIDVRKLAKIKDVVIGATPVSMALSELSKAIYVASEAEGTITVIDEQSQLVLARMKGKPGVRSIRFAPGGRYGFAVNSRENSVEIFDAATNSLLHDVKVGKTPDQIIFSNTFAFVRSLGTESVVMMRLATIGTEVEITEFPGGQAVPEKASPPARADSMVLAPEGNSVIVANPADKVLYYYTEGMAAPMGNFENYRREPRAVLVVDRGLRETASGVYSANVKLPASGNYEVALLADSPRIAHCFQATAQPNPALKVERPVALSIEYQIKERKLQVGENVSLRFKLIETATNKTKNDLKDVRVLTFSGSWQKRDIARSLGDGIYEIDLNLPETGFYQVFVESASMGVRYRDLPSLNLHATNEKIAASGSDQSTTASKP
jgi:YVTN family beta-propeller protein